MWQNRLYSNFEAFNFGIGNPTWDPRERVDNRKESDHDEGKIKPPITYDPSRHRH